MDSAHLEQIYLQKPGARLTTWKWLAGGESGKPKRQGLLNSLATFWPSAE
jgi:hypothetical protein